MFWQRPGRPGPSACALLAAWVLFGVSSQAAAAGAIDTADLQDGACITVLALGAEKAKPEQRSMFEAGAFYFFGRIGGRHPRSDLVDIVKAAAARRGSAAEHRRCAGEMRAIEGLLGTIVTVISRE